MCRKSSPRIAIGHEYCFEEDSLVLQISASGSLGSAKTQLVSRSYDFATNFCLRMVCVDLFVQLLQLMAVRKKEKRHYKAVAQISPRADLGSAKCKKEMRPPAC